MIQKVLSLSSLVIISCYILNSIIRSFRRFPWARTQNLANYYKERLEHLNSQIKDVQTIYKLNLSPDDQAMFLLEKMKEISSLGWKVSDNLIQSSFSNEAVLRMVESTIEESWDYELRSIYRASFASKSCFSELSWRALSKESKTVDNLIVKLDKISDSCRLKSI